MVGWEDTVVDAAEVGGPASAGPVALTVAVRLSTDSCGEALAEFLSGQPLLPRWMLTVVRGGAAGAADVAVVAAGELGRACGGVTGWGARLVSVLSDPGETRTWNGLACMVLADDPWGYVARAVEEAALGRVWISDGVVPYLSVTVSGQAAGDTPRKEGSAGAVPWELLTPIEHETLELVLDGLSNDDIASARGVSLSTVKSCVRSLLSKYRCASRRELIALFVAPRSSLSSI